MSGLRKVLGSVTCGLLFLSSAFATDLGKSGTGGADLFPRIKVDKLIVMPDAAGHTDWINAISGARTSLHMTMYHLTDAAVIQALVSKASNHAVDLRVIVDGKSLTGGYKKAIDTLTAAGVQVRPSSNAFTITHSKSMVIDNGTAFVTAINMTNTATTTRDFGIITEDTAMISEIDKVFEADWQNATNNGSTTPALTDANLAWSPNNSEAQLIKLIDGAQSTLAIEVENLGSDTILTAFNRAAARGVSVRLIVPECTLGSPLFNYQFLAKLQGVSVHVEHDGKSVAQPYMHSKMMVADGKYVYVGSINYSMNSTLKARELGVIFLDESTAGKITSEFNTDWNRSQVPAATPQCGKAGA